MKTFDFSNPVTYPTENLLKTLYKSHDVDHVEKNHIVEELVRRNADREQFHTELQGSNTKLVLENRALREFIGNRNPGWVADVVIETARAKRMHGDNAYTDQQRACILMEEVGEVANVLCRMYVPPISASLNVGRELKNLRGELVQVASVAVRWVERIDLMAVTADAIHNGGAKTLAEIKAYAHAEPPVDCGDPECATCAAWRLDLARQADTPLSPPAEARGDLKSEDN